MNKIVLFLTHFLVFVFLLLGCQKKEETASYESFKLLLVKTFMNADSIDLHKISLTNGIPLLVVEGHGPSLDKPIQVKYCLYYQRPFKSSFGKLWLSFVNQLEECGISSNAIVAEGFEDFSLEFQPAQKKTYIQIISKINKKEDLVKVPLVNFKQKASYKFAESEKLIGFAPNLRLVGASSMKFKIGNAQDSYPLKTAKRCLQVSENCDVIGENLCNFCRFGSYEVVDYACPQGGSRFCGENRCGEKGEPACPTGKKVFGIEGNSLCFDDSEAGFCQGELRPVCNEDNVLICR